MTACSRAFRAQRQRAFKQLAPHGHAWLLPAAAGRLPFFSELSCGSGLEWMDARCSILAAQKSKSAAL
jgi:hypothetical protein